MTDSFDSFVSRLDARARGTIRGTARLDVSGEGSIFLSDQGAERNAAVADVAMSATRATFEAILDGTQNPIKAVMTGKLKVDGNPMRALKVSELLAG